MKKGKKIISLIILIVIVASIVVFMKEDSNEDVELVTVKSKKELEEIYEYGNDDRLPLWKQIITLPFSMTYYGTSYGILADSVVMENATGVITPGNFGQSDLKAETSIDSSITTRKRLFNNKHTS